MDDKKVLDVYNELVHISYKWNEIGLGLNVDDDVLGGLKRSRLPNAVKLYEVIKSWRTMNPKNATLGAIISAVEGPIVNSKEIAQKLRSLDETPPPSPTPDPPTQPKTDVKVHDVLNVLADISYKWNEIGLALKVDSNVLGGLKRGKESDVLKLHTVIKSWHMENPHNATWDIIISAVEGPIVNSKWTADKIRRLILISPTPIIIEDCTIEDRIWRNNEKGEGVVKECIKRVQASGMFPDDKQFMRRVAYVMSRDGTAPDKLLIDGGIWQVGDYALNDTQDIQGHSRLSRKHRIIEEKFNINWTTVKKQDLVVPMYSAIAARLFLSNFRESIPSSVDKQSDYWWNKYLIGHQSKWEKSNFTAGVSALAENQN